MLLYFNIKHINTPDLQVYNAINAHQVGKKYGFKRTVLLRVNNKSISVYNNIINVYNESS